MQNRTILATIFNSISSKYKTYNADDMKKTLLLLVSVVTLCSCGNYSKTFNSTEITSVRHVRPFTAIKIKGACDVFFAQSDTFGAKVVGPESRVNAIKTSFSGNTLVVSVEKKFVDVNLFNNNPSPVLYITSPDLIGISMEGSGDFCINGTLDTDTLNLYLKGSGDIEMANVICDEFHSTLLGVGDIDIKSLTAKRSDVKLKGVGDVNIHFVNSGYASLDLQGVGDISLSGNVKKFRKRVHGTGDINFDKLQVGQ